MSNKLNPKEVLSYLNELGYTNVTAQQLKEFLTDLKKLIKYEYRNGKSAKSSSPHSRHDNEALFLDSKIPTAGDLTSEISKKREYDHDIFHILHNHHTVSSRTRTVNAREKHISVHITKPKYTKIHDHCVHVERMRSTGGQTGTSVDNPEQNVEELNKVDSSKSELAKASADTLDNCQSTTKQTSSQSINKSESNSKSRKMKSSVIRSSSSKSFSKCDPVALYHQYKEEWKKIKFPGQDHHSDLRWAVREKLMSGPIV